MNKKTILVADDENYFRMCLVELFSLSGYHVVEAQNGVDAFKILNREKIDLVISDIHMPGGNGFELVNAINNSAMTRPIVYLMSGTHQITTTQLETLGISRFLSKPFDLDDLVEGVNREFGLTGHTMETERS